MFKIAAAFGTRAEAIKFAPVVRALTDHPAFDVKVVVTGFHRHPIQNVLELFRVTPDLDLDLGGYRDDLASLFSYTNARLSEVFAALEPDLVLVLGDGVTTLAATLVAYYRQIPVAHIEAGLRVDHKFTTFPQEGHRLMVSSVADLHFAHTTSAKQNLLDQGIKEACIEVTGNPGIDALRWASRRIEAMRADKSLRLKTLFEMGGAPKVPPRFLRALREVELGQRKLALVTTSRPETFGTALQSVCGALARLSDQYPDAVFVYPVELPPTIRFKIHALLEDHENIFLLPPLDYLPFVFLMQLSHFVLTDSGSIQEEAPGLDKPVLVMRRATDRPEAVKAGTARLVGTDAVTIFSAARRLMGDEVHYQRMADAPNPYGEGDATSQIIARLEHYAGHAKALVEQGGRALVRSQG